MPTESDIGLAYTDYYTHSSGSNGSTGRTAAEALYGLLGLAKERRVLAEAGISGTPGRLLDVGCGDGSRLALALQRGWQVDGQDVDEVALSRARELGVTTHHGRLDDIALPEASYDTLTSSHVVEHVHDPLGLLAECHRLLRPGGTAVIATPNLDSFGHRTYGACWRGLEPPRHLVLFTADSLAASLRSVGFKHVEVRTTMARSVGILRRSATAAAPSTLKPAIANVLAAQAIGRGRLAHLRDRDLGEELVAIAQKVS